jgi:hypothetical protein
MLTSDQVTVRLKQAAAAVQDADLPADLRQIGFERALEALGLGAALAPPSDAPVRSDEAEHRSDDNPLLAIARRLNLPIDVVDQIYETDDGTIRLALRRSMLPDPERKAAAMRHVSLLTVAGRQAAGEELTPFAAMREECLALKVLDAPNFASEVGKLDLRLTGARNSRTAKANRHHFEEAAELIQQIVAEPRP